MMAVADYETNLFKKYYEGLTKMNDDEKTPEAQINLAIQLR